MNIYFYDNIDGNQGGDWTTAAMWYSDYAHTSAAGRAPTSGDVVGIAEGQSVSPTITTAVNLGAGSCDFFAMMSDGGSIGGGTWTPGVACGIQGTMAITGGTFGQIVQYSNQAFTLNWSGGSCDYVDLDYNGNINISGSATGSYVEGGIVTFDSGITQKTWSGVSAWEQLNATGMTFGSINVAGGYYGTGAVTSCTVTGTTNDTYTTFTGCTFQGSYYGLGFYSTASNCDFYASVTFANSAVCGTSRFHSAAITITKVGNQWSVGTGLLGDSVVVVPVGGGINGTGILGMM